MLTLGQQAILIYDRTKDLIESRSAMLIPEAARDLLRDQAQFFIRLAQRVETLERANDGNSDRKN